MEYEQGLVAKQTVDQPQQPNLMCHEVGLQTEDQRDSDLRPIMLGPNQRGNRPVALVRPNSHFECDCEFCVHVPTRVEDGDTLLGQLLERASGPLREEDAIALVASGSSRGHPRRRAVHRRRPYSGLLRGVIYQSGTDTD